MSQQEPLGSTEFRGHPNVLIVFPDQWRRQALGCQGDPVVQTPNLDSFAASGACLDRCYATNPVCTPARAVFQSGLYPHQTGMIHNDRYLAQQENALARVFRRAGYQTGYIGKWHIGGSEKPGFVAPAHRQGYDYFEGFNRGHYYGPDQARWFTNEGQFIQDAAGFESEIQTDMAIKYMKAANPGSAPGSDSGSIKMPFLLFLSWGPPHPPYDPPPGFDHYKPHDLQWRENVPAAFRGDEQHQRELCGYYGLCEALDHQMGRLMKFLDDSGLARNTIVLFTSDHGDRHGSHNQIRKSDPEEESLGIPLMVRYPGVVPAGVRTQTLASTLDFSPTLIALAGLQAPAALSGRDLSPVLRGGSVSAPLVYCSGRMMAYLPGKEWRAIVTDRYKLAVHETGEVYRLSDLQEDPLEMNNLATDEGVKGVRDELLARLKDHARKIGDPFPQRCTAAPSEPPTP